MKARQELACWPCKRYFIRCFMWDTRFAQHAHRTASPACPSIPTNECSAASLTTSPEAIHAVKRYTLTSLAEKLAYSARCVHSPAGCPAANMAPSSLCPSSRCRSPWIQRELLRRCFNNCKKLQRDPTRVVLRCVQQAKAAATPHSLEPHTLGPIQTCTSVKQPHTGEEEDDFSQSTSKLS